MSRARAPARTANAATSEMILVSANFSLAYVTASAEAKANGIDNALPDHLVDNARRTAESILEPVMAQFGSVKINSWFRCEALEKHINWGGNNVDSAFAKWCIKRGKAVLEQHWPAYFALKSHPRAEAVDFEVNGVSNAELARWCRDNLPAYDQILLEFHRPAQADSGWVHASRSATGKDRRECLTITSTGTVNGLPA